MFQAVISGVEYYLQKYKQIDDLFRKRDIITKLSKNNLNHLIN